MSNYTKSTNFTAKDSLPTGDTNKVIRGTEFDTEFNAISTAISTKSDLAGPTFTGTATFDGITATGTVNFTGGSVTTNIDGGTIDGVTIGGSSAGAGTFSSLTATTADINGGTVDGVTIGGSSAGAGTFSSLTATTADINAGTVDNTVIGGTTPAAGTFTAVAGTTGTFSGAVSGTTGTFSGAVTGSNLNISNWDTAFGWGNHATQGYLTSVTFSDMDAGAITTSGETFTNSDTQIPTNAAVRNWVLTTYPTIVELNDLTANVTWANVPDANITQSSVTQHQAALSIAASQLSDVTATATELNYVDGVTSNIQTQIDSINPSPTLTATASGALANGDLVLVNSDGTVSVVAETGISTSSGTPAVFESAYTDYISATYDSNAQKVVIAYRDGGNTDYGTAIVGTVSGTSISFGTPVVFESAGSLYISATYDPNAQKVVIAYSDGGNSDYGKAIVGTVSGTSISFGTEVVFESAGTSDISATYDTNAQKVVIAYSDQGNSSYGTAIVGTVSGTSISFGTPVVFESALSYFISATYDTNAQKVVIAYSDNGNSDYGTAIVGTVSGTSISFGTAVVFESAGVTYMQATYDANAQKAVIAYSDGGNSGYGTAIVGTVSGTSISFGTAVVFESAQSTWISATYDANAQKVVIAYTDGGNSNYGTAIVGTVSGTSISFGTEVVFESAYSLTSSATYDANAQKVVIAYTDNGNSGYGTAVVLTAESTSTNLTAENYIGISDAAYSDATTATIQIVGSVDDAQTGLTAGQKYFVQGDGSLGLTADSPEVFAGTAVSSTQLIVKG